MDKPLENLSYSELRNRCLELNLPCSYEYMTKTDIIKMIKESEEQFSSEEEIREISYDVPMDKPLEDFSYRELRKRCDKLNLPCSYQHIPRTDIIKMIKEREEEIREGSYNVPKIKKKTKISGSSIGTLSERLGSSLDEFAYDLEEFVSQFLTSEFGIDFYYAAEISLSYSDSLYALYYRYPDHNYVDDSYILIEVNEKEVVVTIFSVLYDVSRNPDFDDLNSIAKYGINRFSNVLYHALKQETITIGDYYTLLVKNVKGNVTTPEEYLPPSVKSSYSEVMGFAVIITFDAVNETEYRSGGTLYEEGRRRFEKGK